jgi:hypothetical protein
MLIYFTTTKFVAMHLSLCLSAFLSWHSDWMHISCLCLDNAKPLDKICRDQLLWFSMNSRPPNLFYKFQD